MPLRYRKTVKLLPGLKLNVGKKSVGFSVGGKYGGYSWNSRTGARARVSAPGTGLFYVTSGGGGNAGMDKKPKKPFYKRWYFWVLLLLIIGSCSSTGDKTTPAAASSKSPMPSPTVIAAAATPAPSSAPAASATPAPSPTPRVDDYILNTNTRKFHETYCSKADNIKSGNRAEFSGTREELIQRGYEPCAVCNP